MPKKVESLSTRIVGLLTLVREPVVKYVDPHSTCVEYFDETVVSTVDTCECVSKHGCIDTCPGPLTDATIWEIEESVCIEVKCPPDEGTVRGVAKVAVVYVGPCIVCKSSHEIGPVEKVEI